MEDPLGATFVGSWLVSGLLALSPWGRYRAAVALAASCGLLPWRTDRFLDWAVDAGLLRMSGSAMQFRHREFQRHLTR